jgi:hypothetical protein
VSLISFKKKNLKNLKNINVKINKNKKKNLKKKKKKNVKKKKNKKKKLKITKKLGKKKKKKPYPLIFFLAFWGWFRSHPLAQKDRSTSQPFNFCIWFF